MRRNGNQYHHVDRCDITAQRWYELVQTRSEVEVKRHGANRLLDDHHGHDQDTLIHHHPLSALVSNLSRFPSLRRYRRPHRHFSRQRQRQRGSRSRKNENLERCRHEVLKRSKILRVKNKAFRSLMRSDEHEIGAARMRGSERALAHFDC